MSKVTAVMKFALEYRNSHFLSDEVSDPEERWAKLRDECKLGFDAVSALCGDVKQFIWLKGAMQ